MPTRNIVSLSVTISLEAMDPGTIQARLKYIQDSVRVGEGILTTQTGSGHGMSWLATPGGDSIQEALTGTRNEVEITFTAVENHECAATAAIPGGTYTPAGGSSVIHLHALREIDSNIRTDRHGDRMSARKLTTTTRSFIARIYQTNPVDSASKRLQALMAKAEEIKSLNTREGILSIGGVTSIVRIQEFKPVIDEGRGILDLRVQCSMTVLPNTEKAEASFDLRTRRDEGTGEKVIALSGTIDAETRAIALAKLEAIRVANATGSRRTANFETTDRQVDGEDTGHTSGDDWTGGISFSIEFREPAAGSHYNLKVTVGRNIREGMRWSYTGSVRAASDGAAITIARTIGGDAEHPIRTRSEEVVDYVTDLDTDATERFVQCSFTYEYEGPSDGFIGGDITADESRPLMGEWTRSVSGSLVATSKAVAETRLNLLLAAESAGLERTLRWSTTYLDDTGSDVTPKQVFQKLDFSLSNRLVATRARTQYTDTETVDESSMELIRSVSGSIWTDTEANSEACLTELRTALFGSTAPQKITKTKPWRRWAADGTKNTTAGTAEMVQMDFSFEITTGIAGTPGYDIIEASYTLERTGCINLPVITPIPFARPVAQTNTGYAPGTMVMRAQCKARLTSTAREWAQGKRAIVEAVGTGGTTRHETSPPVESVTPEYPKFDGTTPKLYNFTGNYTWTFIGTDLDALWPGTLVG